MTESSPFQLLGAVVVGVWVAGTAVALLALWRRAPAGHGEKLPSPATAVALPDESPLVRLQAGLSSNVFNLSSLPIWWLDRSLRLAGANAAYARAVGHPTPESAVAANAELAPGARGIAAEARETDRAVVGEERATIDGERRLLEILAVPLHGGEVVQLALDETRRHAAYTLAVTRARELSDTLDELAVGTAWFDHTITLKHASVSFARMFGLDPAWLETRPSFERVLDAARAASRLPEERDFVAWRGERRAWFDAADEATLEEDWHLPGGALLHIIGKTRAGGVLLLCEDRTAVAAIAAEHDRLLSVHHAILDRLPQGIAVFGPDGRLKLFNRRFAEIVVAAPDQLEADMPAERLIAHISGLLSHPEQASDLRELIVRATAGRSAHRGRVASALGYMVEYSAVPLPDGNALITFDAARGTQPTAR